MKCRVKLVEAEEITLQEMAINHRFKNTRRRATGLLMLARGNKPKVICEALGVSDQAVTTGLMRGVLEAFARSWAVTTAVGPVHFAMTWSLSRWRLRGQSR